MGRRGQILDVKFVIFFSNFRFSTGIYEDLREKKSLTTGLAGSLVLARAAIEEKNLEWPGLQCCLDFFLAEFCHRVIKFQLKNLENSGVLGGKSKKLSLRTNLNAICSASKKRKTRSSDK